MGLVCIQAGIVNNHDDDIGVAIGDDEYMQVHVAMQETIRGSKLGGKE